MLLGLIGKPSCGKSTFFKAATLADVLIASYPFATIKPNHGIGYVRVECIDREFKVQCQPRMGVCLNGIRFVPIDLMDVAGLVPGASEGKGLGNQFLDDLRQADAFIHIVDVSGTINEEGKQAENYDPCKDVDFLEKELDKWYLGIFNKVWKTFSKTIRVSQKNLNFEQAIEKQFSGLKINEEIIKKAVRKSNVNPEKASQWNEEELMKFVHELRIASKPMIIAANKIDMPRSRENYEILKKKYPDYTIIPCSADFELALREAAKNGLIEYMPGSLDFKIKKDLNEKQKIALENIKKRVLDVYKNTGVQQILDKAVFEILKMVAIFPASPNKLADSKGNILPDCFLLKEGSTALDFAFHLHTDIGKGFVKAVDARTGKAVGKDYKLKHRDALEILTK